MRIKHTILLAAMILCAITLKAQKAENFLAAVGSPPNPKVAVSWNRYNDYTAITDICKKLAAAYPNLVKLESMGKSFQGKELWVITITDQKIGNSDRKPAMYIDGTHAYYTLQQME